MKWLLLLLIGCKHSPPAEGRFVVSQIERAARVEFERSHQFCPSTDLSHKPNTAWDDPTWKCLRFSVHQFQTYSYSFRSNGLRDGDAECTITASKWLGGSRFHEITVTLHGTPSGEVTRVETETEK